MVSLFTLDSAAEFLFGYEGSLSSGFPYPYYVTTGKISSSEEHPSSRFVTALTEAQNVLASRICFGMHWPLAEFWEDKLKKPMSIVHDFINPIVAQAIKRKRATEADSGLEKDRDDETLLEYRGPDNPPRRGHVFVGCWYRYGTLVLMVKKGAIHHQVLDRLRAP